MTNRYRGMRQKLGLQTEMKTLESTTRGLVEEILGRAQSQLKYPTPRPDPRDEIFKRRGIYRRPDQLGLKLVSY